VGSIQFGEWHDDRDSTRRIGLRRRHARQGWECGGHPLPNAEIDEQVPSSPRHSGLMMAALITLPHFSVSSAMSLPKSSGDPGSAVLPKSASRALI